MLVPLSTAAAAATLLQLHPMLAAETAASALPRAAGVGLVAAADLADLLAAASAAPSTQTAATHLTQTPTSSHEYRAQQYHLSCQGSSVSAVSVL